MLETTFAGPGRARRPIHLRAERSSTTSSRRLCSRLACSACGDLPVSWSSGRWSSARGRSPRIGAALEELVRRYGSDTLAYFALARQQELLLLARRPLGCPLRLHGWLRAGVRRPDRPSRSARPTIDEFLAFCRGRGWNARLPVGRARTTCPTYERAASAASISATRRSSAATASRSKARTMKQVRSAVNRVGKQRSLQADPRDRRAARAWFAQLNEISASVARRRGRARLHDGAGARRRGHRARLPDRPGPRQPPSAPSAFLRLVPCYGDDPGYSLDLMRREPGRTQRHHRVPDRQLRAVARRAGIPPPVDELRRLGPALRGAARASGPLERFERWLATASTRYFQIESLRDFNEKFQPEWLPRSIVVEDPAAIPRVGLAVRDDRGLRRRPGDREDARSESGPVAVDAAVPRSLRWHPWQASEACSTARSSTQVACPSSCSSSPSCSVSASSARSRT